ncbi:MAG: hypothetical protein MZV49_03155 [Rhodopseudomonas palustris]|nr:hypothetical protein [Rhodopseudomonas palustris]
MIMAMVVVLPAPLPPSSPVMLPRATVNDAPSTARPSFEILDQIGDLDRRRGPRTGCGRFG